MKAQTTEGQFIIGWEYDNVRNPDITKCILRDATTKEIIKTVSVTRYYKDSCKKEKARVFFTY